MNAVSAQQQRKRLLITGARGLIGGILQKALEADYEVSGLDSRRRGLFRARGEDMTSLASVESRFAGQDVVIDLAADPRAGAPDDPELRADLVLAAANEALRAAAQAVETKLRSQMPDLGALGLPGK